LSLQGTLTTLQKEAIIDSKGKRIQSKLENAVHTTAASRPANFAAGRRLSSPNAKVVLDRPWRKYGYMNERTVMRHASRIAVSTTI
jgi:hypothetical protein